VPTMKSTNLFNLQRTLEIGDEANGGIVFLDANDTNGPGVRLRRRR